MTFYPGGWWWGWPYVAYTGMCRWTGYIILRKSALNSVHDLCKYVLVMKLRELS